MSVKHFVDSNGVLVLSASGEVDTETLQVLYPTPIFQADTDEPPLAGGPWRLVGRSWVPVEKSYWEKRQAEYLVAFPSVFDQLDALHKGLSMIIKDLVRSGVLTPDTIDALTPNSESSNDSPAGWLGKIADIKARNPKPAVQIDNPIKDKPL